MVSFAVQKLLSLIRFHLFIFVFIFLTSGGGSKKVSYKDTSHIGLRPTRITLIFSHKAPSPNIVTLADTGVWTSTNEFWGEHNSVSITGWAVPVLCFLEKTTLERGKATSPWEILEKGDWKLEEAGVLFPVAERLQVPGEEMTQWCLWAAEATERLKEFPVPKPSLNTSLLSKAQE